MVTSGGSKLLDEKLCIRPTSETLFCDYYSAHVKSYRDLPMLYNQWCNVLNSLNFLSRILCIFSQIAYPLGSIAIHPLTAV